MDDLIDDIKQICSIDEQAFNRIMSIYKDTKTERLERALLLKKFGKEGENSKAIKAFARFMKFVTLNIIDERDFEKAIDSLEDTILKIGGDDPDVSCGWNKIKQAINQLDEYFIEKKIEEIKDRYSRIDSFQVITDVRPIFNMKRNNIKTSIYPYILKIDTIDDKSITCEFYDDEIDTLIDELELAKKKMISLKDRYE